MSSSTGIMGIKEMADYLNMKEQTVYRLVQQRKIPAIKIGGQWKAKKNHIDRLFDDMLQEKIKEIQKRLGMDREDLSQTYFKGDVRLRSGSLVLLGSPLPLPIFFHFVPQKGSKMEPNLCESIDLLKPIAIFRKNFK